MALKMVEVNRIDAYEMAVVKIGSSNQFTFSDIAMKKINPNGYEHIYIYVDRDIKVIAFEFNKNKTPHTRTVTKGKYVSGNAALNVMKKRHPNIPSFVGTYEIVTHEGYPAICLDNPITEDLNVSDTTAST